MHREKTSSSSLFLGRRGSRIGMILVREAVIYFDINNYAYFKNGGCRGKLVRYKMDVANILYTNAININAIC